MQSIYCKVLFVSQAHSTDQMFVMKNRNHQISAQAGSMHVNLRHIPQHCNIDLIPNFPQ